jgi:GR25 family glycosyltransferase involved in LPS biosynthesis
MFPINGQQIPIFVISLARAPERRASIELHLKELGLSYEVVNAVDGKLLPVEEQQKLLAPGVSYVPGVIGCYLSHVGVYQEIVKRSIPIALVLEDDARLNRAIVPALKAGSVATNFDYCLLDCDDVSEDIPAYYDPDSRQLLTDGFPIYETNVGPALLHAYLMTQEGARKRIAHAWPIEKPVDVYHHLRYRPDIRVCVNPKGAWVSEYSRQSFTSERNETAPLRLKFLRQFSSYFKLRDWLKLKPIKGLLAISQLKRQGVLAPDRRWRPMPSGRNILE